MSRHVVYLHGFASSPESGKARRFADACASRGIGFTCPATSTVELLRYQGYPHVWQLDETSAAGSSTARLIWEFFSAHPLEAS